MTAQMVYRVENSAGEGAYSVGVTSGPDGVGYGPNCPAPHRDLPWETPTGEKKYHETSAMCMLDTLFMSDYRFGFDSFDKFEEWFPPRDRRKLWDAGCRLRAIALVPGNVYKAPRQVLFDPWRVLFKEEVEV